MLRNVLVCCLISAVVAGCADKTAIDTSPMTKSSENVPSPNSEPRLPVTEGEWIVEDINGDGVIDNSRATLNFAEEGSLYGRSSCNSYSSSWKTVGDNGVEIGPVATTRKACAIPLMDQEAKFLAVLSAAKSLRLTGDDALILEDENGASLTARRERHEAPSQDR